MTKSMRRYVVRVDDQPHTFNLACGPYSGPLYVAAALAGLEALHVVEFWAEHDTDLAEEPRTFLVVGTGHALPEDAHWVGTCDRTSEGLVWHLYELDGDR